tara:strand:+ start:603 stop:2630 length:2028 start_codon:yes stop_codon:yes gene_type:complete
MVDYNKYFSAFDGIQDSIARTWAGLIYAVSMLLIFISRPIDMVLNAIAEVQKGAEIGGVALMDLSWVFKIVFSIFGFLFVFSTDSTDTVIDQSSPEFFGLHVLLARATIFFSSLMAAFIGASDVLVKVSARMPGLDIGLPSFGGQFSEYTAAFVHGATSLTIIASAFLWEEEMGLAKQLSNATATDPTKRNDTSVAYLTLILVAAYVLKLWQELMHGSQQKAVKETTDTIGAERDLADMYKFKHARGPAITISVALLMYMLSNLPTDTHWYDDLWATPAYVLLVAYIVAVAFERVAVAKGQEWVYGGSHGIVVIGGIVQVLLFFTGTLVGNHMTQSSIVFALGVVVLDAMRVGYGQATPDSPSAMSTDKSALLYRLFQGLFGILAFTLLTVTPHETVQVFNETTGALIKTEVTQTVNSPVLFGIGLASALVKVLSLLFLTKTLFRNGTENYYREIASTGLLFCSAYLWEHPLDETMRPGWAILFFVLAILARFADSFIHHVLLRGVDLKSYVTWYVMPSQGDPVDSPTSDNPRVWLTLAALVSSLYFSAMVMNDDWDNIRLDNYTDASNNTVDAPLNEEQSSGMITAVFFISLHVAVVILGLLSEAMPVLEMGALSRSKFIRTAVATVVISSLSVSAGALTIGEAALLSSDSSEARLVLALVSYIVADTVGRELV